MGAECDIKKLFPDNASKYPVKEPEELEQKGQNEPITGHAPSSDNPQICLELQLCILYTFLSPTPAQTHATIVYTIFLYL